MSDLEVGTASENSVIFSRIEHYRGVLKRTENKFKKGTHLNFSKKRRNLIFVNKIVINNIIRPKISYTRVKDHKFFRKTVLN